ncbi:MAG: class I SAM-dependent methyltransferase [Ignavibacteriae bacterium]|nr:class I SAM-dependent methyltransferase [Ignavibacteriota bacterium]MCB9207930.1 class I SAM-dependent methyltransferase [Ignavibacteriales bacterium]MCB9258700.1 class I SAM-dependent methyltransferase [Ignavibacteriales bacterium]
MSKQKAFRKRDDFGNFDSNFDFLKKIKQFTKQIEILEIGSGKGRLLSKLVEEGYNVSGIELRQEYIDRSFELYGKLPVEQMSGDNMKFSDSKFDCVISFDVFEHIPDSDKHLSEVNRVLKNGGFYLLQTPNKWTNTIFETIRWKSFTSWRQDHCSLHNYWQIQKRFNKHNFEVEFYDVPIVTDFFKFKIKSFLGNFGLTLIKIINPDKLPRPLKTNFYIMAKKTN